MPKYEAGQLFDAIDSEHSITCSNCSKTETIRIDDAFEASDIFFNQGWRSTKYNVYCPKCSKKKLK